MLNFLDKRTWVEEVVLQIVDTSYKPAPFDGSPRKTPVQAWCGEAWVPTKTGGAVKLTSTHMHLLSVSLDFSANPSDPYSTSTLVGRDRAGMWLGLQVRQVANLIADLRAAGLIGREDRGRRSARTHIYRRPGMWAQQTYDEASPERKKDMRDPRADAVPAFSYLAGAETESDEESTQIKGENMDRTRAETQLGERSKQEQLAHATAMLQEQVDEGKPFRINALPSIDGGLDDEEMYAVVESLRLGSSLSRHWAAKILDADNPPAMLHKLWPQIIADHRRMAADPYIARPKEVDDLVAALLEEWGEKSEQAFAAHLDQDYPGIAHYALLKHRACHAGPEDEEDVVAGLVVNWDDSESEQEDDDDGESEREKSAEEYKELQEKLADYLATHHPHYKEFGLEGVTTPNVKNRTLVRRD